MFYEPLKKISDYFIEKLVKPDIEVNDVTDLDERIINYLIENGIEGVILDIDETIRCDMDLIDKENEKWLDLLKSKLDVIALSNGYDTKIKKQLKEKGIDYIGLAFKPLRPGFLLASYKLHKSPTKIAVIGDDLWLDVHGGNKNLMTTIKVSEKTKRI